MNAPAPLDQTRVLAALGAIAKADPDRTPIHHCNGDTLDVEVPDRDSAAPLTRLLDGITAVRATPLYDTGWAGTITGCPVRVLVTRMRGRRSAA